ncbi:Spy/CpxP family protein refolding chaperone [Veronia pacifica]|uniref:Stress adaptor protein CpxP n=1 Tax=Veronia pacifica TaxID=1080227 RepID=A0A1C3EGK9_9GAMM|nr:Spy/CpxP family protein refolding chaperone [Veronia pacifica]ODA32396.1 hypothetical protein A8L45_13075 [Veronia pacifica]
MKMAKRILTMLAATSLLAASGTALAYGDKHHGGKHQGNKEFKRLLRGVDLNDEQKEQIRALRTEQKTAIKAERKENRQSNITRQAQVQQLILADTLDEQAVRLLAEEMVNNQVERRVKMLTAQHKMLSVLTPEQKETVAENIKKLQKRKAERLERHNNN